MLKICYKYVINIFIIKRSSVIFVNKLCFVKFYKMFKKKIFRKN